MSGKHQETQLPKENVGLKGRLFFFFKFYEEQFSYVVFPLSVFEDIVEAKTVKVTYVSVFPVQDRKNLFPELFRGLVGYATAKQGV